MAIQIQGNGGTVAEVGGSVFRAVHVHVKPLEWGTLGHYRANHRCALANTQAANSRLFEGRNTHATNLIVPTRFLIKWLQTGVHTAAIEDSIDVFRCTAFSAVDTTNTVTPTASVKRTSMAVSPGALALRGVTIAGAAAGMTGGTLTKDGGSVSQTPLWLTLAFTDPAQRNIVVTDVFDDVNGTHPFVWVQNEGFEAENRVLLGAAAASSIYFDLSWAEVTAF